MMMEKDKIKNKIKKKTAIQQMTVIRKWSVLVQCKYQRATNVNDPVFNFKEGCGHFTYFFSLEIRPLLLLVIDR